MRAELRHLPLVEVREAVVQRVRDRELEHGVAEKLEPLVRLAPLGGPARMRERRRGALRRQRRDQLGKSLPELLVRGDVVDCLADRRDLLGVVVGDLDPELVLELHDQLDEVE